MTRNEAEKRILEALETIRDVYTQYNPNGRFLSVIVSKTMLQAENAFGYGQEDHDFPLCVSKFIKEEEK